MEFGALICKPKPYARIVRLKKIVYSKILRQSLSQKQKLKRQRKNWISFVISLKENKLV